MRSPALLTAIAALVITGCASPGGVGVASSPGLIAETATSYFPLAVGNRWTYLTQVGDRQERNDIRIEKREGGFYEDNRGGRLRFDVEGLRDEARYLIHLPLQAGHRWESRVPGGAVERYEILTTDAVIEVPAGRFQGVLLIRAKTRVDPRTELEREWAYARGVGLLRIETTAVVDGKQRVGQPTIELGEFSLHDTASSR